MGAEEVALQRRRSVGIRSCHGRVALLLGRSLLCESRHKQSLLLLIHGLGIQ